MPTVPVCPRCGAENPAVQHRSDQLTSYRCDACKFEWTGDAPPHPDTDLPPLPAIEPFGG